MSSSSADISSLTEEQQSILQQYTSITNQEVDAAIPLLQRSQWNVQVIHNELSQSSNKTYFRFGGQG